MHGGRFLYPEARKWYLILQYSMNCIQGKKNLCMHGPEEQRFARFLKSAERRLHDHMVHLDCGRCTFSCHHPPP